MNAIDEAAEVLPEIEVAQVEATQRLWNAYLESIGIQAPMLSAQDVCMMQALAAIGHYTSTDDDESRGALVASAVWLGMVDAADDAEAEAIAEEMQAVFSGGETVQ